MILGIGNDLTSIERIAALLEKHGARFEDRLFTPEERAEAAKRVNKAATYAKRFAAKEACMKALGTGFRKGTWFHDVGVVNAPSGQPFLVLSGGAQQRLEEITPEGMTPKLHLSLTDDAPWAQAFVVIEAVPN